MKKLIGGNDPLFPWILHPRHLFEFGRELGFSEEHLLANTGLSPSDIEDVNLSISWQQYRSLADVVALRAADWGFQFGQRLPVASHGLLGLLLLNCVNGEQIIEIQESYPLLVSPIFYVQRRDTENHCVLTIHPEFSRDLILRQSMEAYFSLFFSTACSTGGISPLEFAPAIKIQLQGERPSYATRWEGLFHGALEWNSHIDRVWIHKDILSLTIPNADPESANVTRRILQAQLNQMPAQKGGLHELRDLFASGVYRQDQCADYLFTTLPTLKRYLKGACTTFSRELTKFRIEEALWHSQFGDVSMSELADSLGFQDVNSFGRLFKSEVGVSFTQYRHRYR